MRESPRTGYFRADGPGLLEHSRHQERLHRSASSGDIQIERKLKVVIDCGNGVAGAIAPELLAAIGAEVEPLFCEVDGTFPHHHPDPSDPKNLQDLISVVKRVGAESAWPSTATATGWAWSPSPARSSIPTAC